MALSNQVQLRGGTSVEHESFTGAPREITVDTTLNTIRVHDGLTKSGHIITRKVDLDKVNTDLNKRIDDMQNNLGGSHNHDDRYAGLWNPTISGGLNVDNIRLSGRDVIINGKRALVGHGNDGGNKLIVNYDNDYGSGVEVRGKLSADDFWVHGHKPMLGNHRESYYGFCTPEGNENDWIRTTGNGIIPFRSGGYSSIGTSSWKFNEGWFNSLNAHTININKNGNYSRINFSAQENDPGYIEHFENNNYSHLRVCVSDDIDRNDEIQFGSAPGGSFVTNFAVRGDGTAWFRGAVESTGYIVVNGRRLYVGSRPGDAPDGSVSIG